VNVNMEQLVKDILTQAIKDGLVMPPLSSVHADRDPQARTTSELSACTFIVHKALLRAGEKS